jgi:hypothetical protein
MTASVLVAFAGVFAISALGVLFAWMTVPPQKPEATERSREQSW